MLEIKLRFRCIGTTRFFGREVTQRVAGEISLLLEGIPPSLKQELPSDWSKKRVASEHAIKCSIPAGVNPSKFVKRPASLLSFVTCLCMDAVMLIISFCSSFYSAIVRFYGFLRDRRA